ncbi:MAG: DUF1697 domain-containing protein [Melioribacteraceae bacterium]|nr:DUF1697 domain-containing protein [Melioribacteraceae bacterium]
MKYISLLRGINVSGKKKIKMADLKELYKSLGFVNVITYIQSGNVIFESNEKKGKVKVKIETEIKKKYQFAVPVLVLIVDEFKTVLNSIPFKNIDLEKEGGKNCNYVFISITKRRSDYRIIRIC